MAKIDKLTRSSLSWLERSNPLRGMSISEVQAVFDCARNGDTQRLHWLYNEIEGTNPVLLTCVERRTSALAGFRYGAAVRASAPDQALADEQKAAIEEFIAGIENFQDVLEHLDLAFFRGFSFAQPLWEADGTVKLVSLPDSWLFLKKDGKLFFNPECNGMSSSAVEVTPQAELIGLSRRRAIDYPAMAIHIRAAVGERDWGRFLERVALPKPAVFMAPNATEENRRDYLDAAESVEDGKVSVWPNGTNITDFAGGSRGQDPFSTFIRHQDEKIVLLATGGTLTSLAAADTGSLAGGAQMDVWREIVARDAVALEKPINRMVSRFLSLKFPNRPQLADFVFDREKELTPKEVADLAVSLKNAGWRVDQSELEERTGFTLEKVEESAPQGGGFAFARAKAAETKSAESPKEFLEAFSKDLSPAAEAVKELLKDPTPEKAKELLERLPDLLPEDPEMAAIIADEMAKAFSTELAAARQVSSQEITQELAEKVYEEMMSK